MNRLKEIETRLNEIKASVEKIEDAEEIRKLNEEVDKFTEKIDTGLIEGSTLEEFIEWSRYHYGGYGLGQWCTVRGLTELYNFAQDWGTSIADAEMQCAFTVFDIQSTYPDLWETLSSIENPTEAGYKIGIFYDGTSYGAGYIGQLANEFYSIYAKNGE